MPCGDERCRTYNAKLDYQTAGICDQVSIKSTGREPFRLLLAGIRIPILSMCLLFKLWFLLATKRSAFQPVQHRRIFRRSASRQGARLATDIDASALLLRDQRYRRVGHQLRNHDLELSGDSDTGRRCFGECRRRFLCEILVFE